MALRTRQVVLREEGRMRQWITYNGALYYTNYDNPVPGYTGTQTTSSTGHPWPLLKRSGGDIGGSFSTTKTSYGHSNTSVPEYLSNQKPGYTSHFEGPQLAVGLGEPDWSKLQTSSSRMAMDSFGTTAISQTIPTNPVAGASVFLGELREGLPSMIGSQLLRSRARDYRKMGSEYLNVEFGWKPFVSDLRKFAVAVKDSEKILKQLHRDSGRNVRRRYNAPEVSHEEVIDLGLRTPWPGLPTDFYRGDKYRGPSRRINRFSQRRWFSGAYTYYIDPRTSRLGQFSRLSQEANKLLGTRITPSTLWDLAPWSWAADWFANTGDVIHNLSAFQNDGLVLRYGYVMETTTVTVTYELSGIEYVSSRGPHTFSQSFERTWKTRSPATPYGFGLNFDGFSPRQLAIIAALGISKGGSR